MRKLVFILAISVVALQSCNSSQAKNKNTENENATAISSELVTEDFNAGENIADVPTESVSENNGAAGGTVKLTKEKFLKEVWDYNASPQEWKYKGDKPALIDFYADWCGPCKIAAPILEEISNEYAGKITVYKIDTQVEQELAQVFGISGIPAFLYIPKEGKPAMTSGIGRSNDETKKMFKERIDTFLLSAK